MTIWFDLDGTLADLYSVNNWLESLCAYDPTPYMQANVMHNMNVLARYLNLVQRAGCKLGVISWLSRNSNETYDAQVTTAKLDWLNQHLHSVEWNEIHIVAYGTPKENFIHTENDILFDDEERNRNNWTGQAYSPNEILNILKTIAKEGRE